MSFLGTFSVFEEEKTGILTGLLGYIHDYAPAALRMPAANYSDYYRPPWATHKYFEDRHRTLSQDIGNSIMGEENTMIICIIILPNISSPMHDKRKINTFWILFQSVLM